jgi:hypothetical protein
MEHTKSLVRWLARDSLNRACLPLIVIGLLLPLAVGCTSGNPGPMPDSAADYEPAQVVINSPISAEFASPSALWQAASPARDGGRPRLEIPVTNVTLASGEARWNYRYTFAIRNAGEAMLQVVQLRTTCSCLRARLSSSAIPPNHVALLEVQLDLLAGSPRLGTIGVIRAGVILETTDPAWPQASVWIEAGPPD